MVKKDIAAENVKTQAQQDYDDLVSFFGLDRNSETDEYPITLTPKIAQAIAKVSKKTAAKLIESGKVRTFDDQQGQKKTALFLPKRYSLTNKETIALQATISTQILSDYYNLRAELVEGGMSDSDVDDCLSSPAKASLVLTEKQKEILMAFLREAQSNQNRDLQYVTSILSSRVCFSWDMSDTNNLPQSVVTELLYFIEREKDQWRDEEENDPKQ